MFALADINSCYASCETLFRPDLRGKPVVVLSSNDGCVIARSREAKWLKIGMGDPWFKIKSTPYPEKVYAFSSNFSLYHSLTERVMRHIEELAPSCERYSVDEVFLMLDGMNRYMSYETYGQQLREHVRRGTGLIIGVGMGPTKTLAKSSQWGTKEWPQFKGVLVMTRENHKRTEQLLSRQPVQEVWGVGRQISKRLAMMGITSALQLAQTNTTFIRKNFGVVLERTVRELNGESCIPLEEAPPAKQQIICSRSFGERVTDFESIRQAICQHAERAAEKLREEQHYCRHITVSIRTSPFSVNEVYYANQASERLTTPTRDTRDIICAATKALARIWQEGHRYAKAGIMLNDFTPTGLSQLNLFDDIQPRAHCDELMKVLDGINHSGLGRIGFAGKGIDTGWQIKRKILSPAYTTKWKDIPIARIC